MAACLTKCIEPRQTAHLVALLFKPVINLCGILWCILSEFGRLLALAVVDRFSMDLCMGVLLGVPPRGGWEVGDMTRAETAGWYPPDVSTTCARGVLLTGISATCLGVYGCRFASFAMRYCFLATAI